MTCEETHDVLTGAGLDLFASAIGAVHGQRGAKAFIDWELAEWLDEHCSVPLVTVRPGSQAASPSGGRR